MSSRFLIVFLILAVTATARAEDSDGLWSLRPRSATPAPETTDKNWPQRELDRFVLARIEAAGKQPTRRAERRLLARRAYLDLHGLPPTVDELRAFVLDNRPDAWARLIDRLLASPRYGERWGRHWLDVARYADSNGMDENIGHPQAYRYRDYVIAAFNDDLPFDRFIIEQLAGDLLQAKDLDTRRRQTTAAGFLSVGPKMLACDDPDKMRRDIVDEQMDTTGRAFLGITLGCARCHDHKYDPISIADYYGLAGIFMSTRTLTKYSVVAKFHQHDLSPPQEIETRKRIAELQKKKKENADEIKKLKEGLPPSFEVMAVTEYPTEDVQVHLRGDYLTLGEKKIPRRIPAALNGGVEIPMPPDQSGRKQLAEWIASPDNPLTARVIANRIWRWHFGRGIVDTPDNFGVLGSKPSHPQLLDHLATKLVAADWSIKALHREIMTSATYQQSAFAPAALKVADPDNLLLARWKPRRLESEALRDSILMKSGRLDPGTGGSMLVIKDNQYADNSKLAEYAKSTRRTIYLPVLRSSGYDGQNAFDLADPAVICGDRRSSTVATQALFLMNSELVHRSSESLADLMLSAEKEATPEQRTRWMVRHLFGRQTTPRELAAAVAFAKTYAPEDGPRATWAGLARTMFASNEFLYIE